MILPYLMLSPLPRFYCQAWDQMFSLSVGFPELFLPVVEHITLELYFQLNEI